MLRQTKVKQLRNYDSFKLSSKFFLEFSKKNKNILILKELKISEKSNSRVLAK